MASSVAQAWLARKVDLDPSEFTPEVENILINCLSNGSHPSILLINQLKSSIIRGLIKDLPALLSKIINQLTALHESLSPHSICVSEKLPYYFEVIKAILASLYVVKKVGSDTKGDEIFRLIGELLMVCIKTILYSGVEELHNGQITLTQTKSITNNLSTCLEHVIGLCSKPRLLCLLLIEKEQNPGFLPELRGNLVTLYNSVISSKLTAIKVLFKPLWDASECIMSPNNLLLKMQNPLEDSLYGIHLLKQAMYTEDVYPWTSLALLVHEEVLGHRYLSLDQSIARFESFRQVRHMSAFVFCSELIAAALRLESQCLSQSLQWYRARCFLLARLPRMLQYWSKKEPESMLPRWNSLPEHLRDCDDVELALIQTSRFTSLYMRKDPTLDLVDNVRDSVLDAQLLGELFAACVARGVARADKLQQVISTVQSAASANPASPSKSNEVVWSEVNKQIATLARVSCTDFDSLVKQHVLTTPEEMDLLWETIQAQPDNNEVLSNSAALIVNSLRTQFFIQEQVVEFTLKILNPSSQSPLALLTCLCDALCSELMLCAFYFHSALPGLLAHLAYYCNQFGAECSEEAYTYFGSFYALLIMLLEFYQVKSNSFNQTAVLHILPMINRTESYDFERWYFDYINSFTSIVLDNSMNVASSVLRDVWIQPTQERISSKVSAWTLLRILPYLLKQMLTAMMTPSTKGEGQILPDEHAMNGLEMLFVQCPFCSPSALQIFLNAAYYTTQTDCDMALSLFTASLDIVYNTNEEGTNASAYIPESIKAAARMLIGHQLASVDKVFENASARAEFQRVIADGVDPEREFTHTPKVELIATVFKKVVDAVTLPVQVLPMSTITCLCNSVGPSVFTHLVLREYFTADKYIAQYPTAIRAAELAGFILGSTNVANLSCLIEELEQWLPKIKTVIEGQCLALILTCTLLHTGLLNTIAQSSRVKFTLAEKEAAVSLKSLFEMVTEVLERLKNKSPFEPFPLTLLELATNIKGFLPRFVPARRLATALFKHKSKHLIPLVFNLNRPQGREVCFDMLRMQYNQPSAGPLIISK